MARKVPDLEIPINMTPMIDIVFQLIIFFIVVIDMSQKDLEDLKLPMARAAVPDKQEENRPIVNLDFAGRVVVRRELIHDPEGPDPSLRTLDPLTTQLALWAQRMKTKFDEDVKKDLPDDPLLIRADKNTLFRHIQKIMELCGREGIQIWKVQLAAAEYKPEEAGP